MRPLLHSFICCLLVHGAHAQFGPAQVISGNYPGVMSDARFTDIDQDGQLDMVCTAPYSSAVLWYRGYGQDLYEPARTAITGLLSPSSFDLGDLNGDGVEDMVIAVAGDDRILWAPNNGFGEYPVVDTLQTSMDQPAWVRIADVDGDGDPDIIAASTLDDRIAWFANNGAGVFVQQQDISTAAAGVKQFAVGDVDGDGDLDVLAALPTTQTLGWYANDGSGLFGAMNVLGTALAAPTSVQLVHLNGDAWPDVLFTYGSDDLVWIPATGDGNFGAITPIMVVNGLLGAYAADLDGDGDQDLVAAHSSSGRILLNDGTGTFAQQALSFSFSAHAVILQDLNNDGLIDLGYRRDSNQDVSYRYNTGGDFGAEINVPRYLSPSNLGASDLDGDGDMDLVVRNGTFSPVVVMLQQFPGVFTITEELRIGTTAITNFLLQDMDQDGLMDIVFRAGSTVYRDLYWKRNLGGTFGPEILLNSSYLQDTSPITLADVDGDGDLDHLVSDPNVGWRRNDGTSFSAHITIDATITAGPVQFADLNGDGLKDLIAADLNGLSAKWYRNMGANAFAAQAAFNTGLSNAVQIHPYDLDGDGDIDLVINGIFNDIGVFLNAGNGSFGTVQGLNTWNFTSTMHVFDVDGDGDLDILNGNYTQFRWSPNDGLGQFGTVQPLQPNEPYSTQLKHSILADMDGDGLTDIVYSEDQETQLEWLPNRINTFFRITGRLFYDLDEDGIRDPEDPPVPWAHVEADPAPNFPFSSNNGSFLAYVDSGTFTVRPIIDTDLWYITSDSLQYTVTLNAQNPVSNGNDFGIFVDQEASDLHLALPNPVGLCADTVPHWIAVVNQGNLVESGILALDHDTLFTVLDAYPPPDSLVGNTYYWHYTDLGYYEQGSFHLTVVRPDAGHLGDSTHFTLRAIQFDPVVPGLILDTITVSRHGVVTCSYDPNDKQVDPVGYGASGAIDLDTDHLDYTIRFQNTGNAPAVSVTLRDTLPPEADLDRLSLLAYSFLPTDLRLDSGNVLVIRLQNILLPDSASDPLGSQGFVSFRTGLVPGLPHGTEISNTAGIYFDLNPPIITNSTLNTLVDCALWQPEITPAGWDALTVTEGDRYHWTLNGEPVPDGDQPTITVTGNGIYAAQVTSPFGCIATATYEFLTTAVNDADAPAFGIVPNPMRGDAVLWSREPLTPHHRIDLVDAQGRSVRSMRGSDQRRIAIPRGELAAGIHAVVITAPTGERSVLRLVVQ